MRLLAALAAGALFGLGLIVSDMVNPARVLGFLDVAGAWDPTLAFVIGGALLPMAFAWRIAGRSPAPVCGGTFPGQPSGIVDRRLIGGSALFGLGWGVVGFCPGPALTALATGNQAALIFTAAMMAAIIAHNLTLARALPA